MTLAGLDATHLDDAYLRSRMVRFKIGPDEYHPILDHHLETVSVKRQRPLVVAAAKRRRLGWSSSLSGSPA